jgi:hypothetical protein
LKRPAASAAPLRLLHAVVFLGFAAGALAAVQLEVLQLWRALTQPYHSGTPPQPLPLAAGAVVSFASLALLFSLARGRSVPLPVSIAMIGGAAAASSVLTYEVKERSAPGANVRCIEAARGLHERLSASPKTLSDVTALAAQAPGGPTPFRRRPFHPLPWHVEAVPRSDVLPEGAWPGWLLVHVDTERGAFTISAVGIDDRGAPTLLRDGEKLLAFEGAYLTQTGQ